MSERIEAGAETNARIAREVMGWEACENMDCGGCWKPVFRDEDGEWHAILPEDGSEWEPSTDRCAALEVVDRLTEAGIDVAMDVSEFGTRVHLTNFDAEHVLVVKDADGPPASALPLAICRAALAPEVLAYLASRPESETQRG